jgi:DNA-binding SARP family transcriptional activator/pimeloyl-ACP methyl ester carboxylesterase
VAVRIIGPFAVETPDDTLTQDALPGRVSVLLKMLALAPNHSLHRDEVIEVLWPDSEPERGRNNLHKALHTLRRAAPSANGCDLVSLNRAMVVLHPAAIVDLDEFHTAAEEAESGGAADLLYALGLASGELLPADIYEDWAAPARDRYRSAVKRLRYSLASQYGKAGKIEQAERQLRAVLDGDPFDERAHRELMRLFAAAGDTRGALLQYDECAAALTEIGETPSQETVCLREELTARATPYAHLREKPCPHIESARTSDGVRIAYHSWGRGFPLVHMPSLLWNNLELEWQVPAWRAWFEQLGAGRTLVRYDGRGQGISDRRQTEVTPETMGLELMAVTDALELEQFDLYAPIHASLGALAFASAYPERVHRMVLFTPYARGRDYLDQPYIAGGYQLAHDDWQMFCQMIVANAFAMGREEVQRAVTSVFVNSSSPEHADGVRRGYLTADVTDRLHRVTMPVLVLASGQNTGFLPDGTAERVAAGLPGAQLHTLREWSLIPIVGDVEATIAKIHGFLDAPD